jgi:hypothetical protein
MPEPIVPSGAQQGSTVPRPSRRHRRRTGLATLAAIALLLVAVAPRGATAQAATGGIPSDTTTTTTTTVPPVSGPPAVPTTGAYLGAFAAPHQSESQAQSDIRQELSQIGNFDGVLGRPLGIVHVYQNWRSPVRDSSLAAFASTGATPIVDWTCTSDASIINGSQDSLITNYAGSLKSYGQPIFLRWFWEMNLVGLPRTSSCLGTLGSAGYVQAFQHIVSIFRQVGATNVAFVWCPSISGSTFGSAYYPGDQFVDWIGWDGYDRKQDPTILQSQFLPFYNHWLPNGKPMMIGETGATIDQATYVANLAATIPSQFPGVKAVIYYDSMSTSDWTLVDAPGNLGLSQFIAMGQLPYFRFPFTGP